ncbi:hypothetical protein [Caudoviricetes sp.]|nr:hypothetical protein [Caudoviricetes sp.]
MAKSRARGKYAAALHRYSGSPNVRYTDPTHILYGLPYGAYESNFWVGDISSGAIAAITSGQGLAVAIPLQEGMTIRRLAFITGSTAGATITNQWGALYDTQATPALCEWSGDLGSAALPASTVIFYDLRRPYTVPITGTYYAAYSITATTRPTIAGKSLGSTVYANTVSGSPVLAQTWGSALGGTAPSTISTPTTTTKLMWMCAIG